MAVDRHFLGRLAVRASVADVDTAMVLRPRIEALAGRSMPAMIERIFDALAPGDLHVRLARLDLDLGTVRPDHLEEDTLAALESALTDALGEAIHAARFSPSDEARLIGAEAARIEAFETYLATGVVPLAARGERFDPAARLHELVAEQPDALVAMLRRRGRERHAIERLVLQAGEAGLRSVLALLAPADAAVILALIADIVVAHREEAAAPLAGLAEPALERLLWVSTFEFLLRDAGTQFNRRRFLAFLLGREARRAGIDYADLLHMLGEAVARIRARTGFRSSLPVVLAELLAESGQALEDPGPEATGEAAAFAAARAGDFAMLLALVRSRAGNAAALEALVRRLDAALFAGLIRLLEPAHAEQILAILDDLGIVHRAEALPVLPEAAFEHRLRLLTLRYLLNDAGSQFNRRRFLGRLLESEARLAGIEYAALLRLLSGAVEQLRTRAGLRSSMPAVLAELLVELKPIYQPAADAPREADAAAALAAAQAGEFAALLTLLRARAGDAAGFETLVDALPAALFEGAIRALEPSSAQAILDDVAALIALHRTVPLAALTEARFARLVRRLVLGGLLRESGRFDRRAWLLRLLRAVAEAAGEPEAALRAALARAIARVGGGGPALAAELRAELDALAVPVTADRLIQRAAELDAVERRRTIAELDPVNAEAVEAELGALARLHAAGALLPLDAARFGALIWALAVEWLRERHGRFDRLALARHLLQGIARHGGKTVDDVAGDVQRSLAKSGAAGDAAYAQIETFAREAGEGRADEDGQRRAIAHFLRTGQPPSAGRGLPALARHDAIWLAALVRRLARETPSAVPGLIERLLDWLLPEELLDCLAPGSTARALVWADGVGSGMAAWRPAFEALLRDETPPFAAAPGTMGKRLDRLALIAHWLDHGTTAWWARGGAPRALLGDLERMTLAELTWLFLGESPERSFERLWRAIEPLGKAARMRLIERLAPWATSPGGPLASALSGLDDKRRLEILARAAAAALEGVQLDLTAVTSPAPAPTPPPSAMPRPDGVASIDSARLFAWLDGAHAGAAETQALLRYFARLADARDRKLIDYLAARRTNAAAQMRWVTVLPPEAIGRVVHLLVPAGARAYLDAAMTIAAAWRQIAPFGARRIDPARIWAMLLAAIAEPGSTTLPGVIERLVEGLTRGDAGEASRLRAQAQRLAQDGGHVAVAAALKRSARPPAAGSQASPRKPEAAKSAAADEEKPVPPDPDHPIFIGNAGLVLLSPYLPALFERLGLIGRSEDGPPRIDGIEAQSRAVHLLQYIADGRTDAPEPELVLNKLLSGVAVAQPIEPSIVPTEAEIETCNGLMHAVIANWTIIKNTSIEGLRETFLQREGRLRHGDARWDLHVQRKGLDVLIDQIPWTFSMIYHRWMADPIHVTW